MNLSHTRNAAARSYVGRCKSERVCNTRCDGRGRFVSGSLSLPRPPCVGDVVSLDVAIVSDELEENVALLNNIRLTGTLYGHATGIDDHLR